MLRTTIKRDNVEEAILTNVNTSRDLSYAKVYYTLLDPQRKAVVQKALEASNGQLRGLLGRELHLRTIPEFHFVYDDSEAKARAMDELLDKVAAMDAKRIPPDKDE